ncbi:MAG: alternative thymidylate synthase-like protein [Nitrospirae bacterium]|nr:MAG: alternative thymidylate synthase-like protein [Nitrospirota bacterium]
MSMPDQRDARRIVALAPMPPEPAAYALARYSRSPDSIEESLRWVHAHSSEKFWEQFYFAYGHGSIADLGHVTICLENISEFAAIRLEDEPLWDGQAKSSRYQNFATAGSVVPEAIVGTEVEARYRGIQGSLFSVYALLQEPLKEFLQERYPRPEGMTASQYERTIAARAYDVTRYLLTLGTKTNVGQVVSIRTLEKQITRFLSMQMPELQAIGQELKEVCAKPPLQLWAELQGVKGEPPTPLAPTLARHAGPSAYLSTVYRDLTREAKEQLRRWGIDRPSAWMQQRDVDLIDAHPPLDEIAATLLYRVSHAPYRTILDHVQAWPEQEKRRLVEEVLRTRGPHDELVPEFRSGYTFIFDVLMDIGGWRDLHRHRRCQQIQQPFTTLHGFDVPPILQEVGLEPSYVQAMEAVKRDIEALRGESQEAALYAIPFGFKVRCLFKMDFAEAEYIARLRSGVKGHWSYRRIAWRMKEQIAARYPFLGDKIEATPPEVDESLVR